MDVITLAQSRDTELDHWMARCSPEEIALTARWLADGSGADHLPPELVAAQERLMEVLEVPAPAQQGAEG